MTFTVIYREKDGAKAETEIEAANRADCFAHCKARGIAPLSVREGRTKRARNQGAPAAAQGKRHAVVLGVVGVLGILALGAWWWLGRDGARPAEPKGTEKPKVEMHPEARPSKPRVAPVPATNKPSAAAQAPAPATNAASTFVKRPGTPELPAVAVVPTNTPSIPPLPPQAFSNASDQVLAMIASADASGDLPPIPISRDIEAEFLKSLQQEIVILDTDDEKTRMLKLAVKETREQLKELIASGKTVAEVLAEHQQLAGENAKVRNDAMRELKQLVDSGDIEGAMEYKRKINIALQQMGIAELSIPVTEEERAERAAGRRERMLKKRAEQAAAAEKLKKENQK